ncbi:MAG: hypothetical protein JO043_08890 [Candidatus Eremiobacteraeota bacterium]|nr:hypothetical protein [Candidatus Eremiobacteraeota bacterium]
MPSNPRPYVVMFCALLAIGTVVTNAALGATPPDATVTSVTASGAPGHYVFNVTIRSNDTGCDHYADWWEVVDERGALLYRRVLLHDHADEQPFTRDGGPVPVTAKQTVTVRAHMNTSGYSSAAMRGTVESGFKTTTLPPRYAEELAKKPPLPERC